MNYFIDYLLFIHLPWVIVLLPYLYYKYITETINKYRTFHEFFVGYYAVHVIFGPFVAFIVLLKLVNYKLILYLIKFKTNTLVSKLNTYIEQREIQKEENKYKFKVVRVYNNYYTPVYTQLFVIDVKYVSTYNRNLYYIDKKGKWTWIVCSTKEIKVVL